MARNDRNRDRDRVEHTWNDLTAYRTFCVDFGYKFNEATMYNMKTYPWQQFNKFRNGKNCKDQWAFDAKRFRLNIGA